MLPFAWYSVIAHLQVDQIVQPAVRNHWPACVSLQGLGAVMDLVP